METMRKALCHQWRMNPNAQLLLRQSLRVQQKWRPSTVSMKMVLSHNLYTVLCIPHDPVALEEHFRDDDDGPVSSQGYMPYLNKYILDKRTYYLINLATLLQLPKAQLDVSLGDP
ncbi:UNVERIFIED_CONTAM: hypothetical protein K2H54_058047 [Gekko kuhli]